MKLKTDALARFLSLHEFNFSIDKQAKMKPREVNRETERLNALPKDQQMQIFCDAMGYGVIEYLMDTAEFNCEIINQIELAKIGEPF